MPIRINESHILRMIKETLWRCLNENIEDEITAYHGTLANFDKFNHKKFALAHGEKSSDFTSMARELILINPDVTLLQALQTMIRAKSHMIFVKDGDGKIAGLLTLEDITDELVDVALPD